MSSRYDEHAYQDGHKDAKDWHWVQIRVVLWVLTFGTIYTIKDEED